MIEISLKGTGEVVARHPRRFGRGTYQTIAEALTARGDEAATQPGL